MGIINYEIKGELLPRAEYIGGLFHISNISEAARDKHRQPSRGDTIIEHHSFSRENLSALLPESDIIFSKPNKDNSGFS